MPTVWAALRICCAKLPFLLSEVVFYKQSALNGEIFACRQGDFSQRS